ncbi:MAG: PIN domain-containing protein [Chloroflexi bacterium]|nr:PIN domain-containing protein [Chloroflexota bacterium]MBI3732937.1 PIN domain-containing protein [Chloroflexota bacterium]
MKISERLQTVRRLFLDSAPVVYYVEESERYLSRVDVVFDSVDRGTLVAVTSPVTLAECLVAPYRKNQDDFKQAFTEMLVNGNNVIFVTIDEITAEKAAEMRAQHNLSLTDAFQVAVALQAGCDAFLTNDLVLKRVSELAIIVLDELEPD